MQYRTYDSAWNRTGYSSEPQYPGQAGVTADYPAKCHCGAEMLGCGEASWLRSRSKLPSALSDAQGYVAWCRNGHEMEKAELA